MTTAQTVEALQDADVAKADAGSIAGTLDELEHRIASGDLDEGDRAEILAWVLPKVDALRAYFVDLATVELVSA